MTMDIASISAKIVGAALFVWTLYSIYKHIKTKGFKKLGDQAVSEMVLNNTLLYLWLAFMTAFSLGMFFNN